MLLSRAKLITFENLLLIHGSFQLGLQYAKNKTA